MSTQGTIESVALSIARLFKPLEEELQPGRIRVLFAELGMDFPSELESKTAFITALGITTNNVIRLPDLIKNLIKAIEDEDFSKISNIGFELFSTIKSIVENIKVIAYELKNMGGTLPGISSADLNSFANNLPKKLLDYLIVKNLEAMPGFVETMEFIDVVERDDVFSGSFSYTKRDLKIDQIFNFISKPGQHFENLYEWGKPSFNGNDLLKVVEKLLNKVGVPAILDNGVNPPELDLTYLEVKPRLDLDPKGLELSLLDKIVVDSQEFAKDDWKIRFECGVELGNGFRFIVQPNGNFIFIPPVGDLSGNVALKWIAGKTDGTPYIILGEAGGSRLEAKQLSIKGGLSAKWNSGNNQATGDFKIGGEIKGGKFLVDFSQGDGFLTEILSNIKLESDFDIGFGYSSKDGVFFYGSSALIVQLASHIDLGPIQINALNLSIGLENGKVPVGLALDIKAELGPLQVVVEQIGVSANLSFPSDQKGNLGPVNLDFGFKPPNGLGLSINAGAVIGGGYLFFDFEKEEYAGAMELTIAGFISVKAIGLITTKMPDGSKGFSMLVIITAEFFPPFQLGYGFTLNGVGGLLGLERTVLLDPLRDGVRTGAVNNIMFPTDVIANAPRIISDLKTIFPVYVGRFLIGPMAKIGWGTPSLITLSFGLIIEIPGNIAILGVLKLVLPDDKVPIVKIQVAFVGTIDFDKKMLTFDASLYESNILQTMTLEGDMAMRLAWGDQPNFIMTVGGFHPSFTPPPLALPTLRRLAVNILNTSIARIRVECYQAVTSNSVQFGARAEVFFDLSACSIDGQIAFDALFQFNPFYFVTTLSAGFKLRAIGIDVMTVRVNMLLDGPTPWHAKGTGKVSLLFFDISADFEKTWGERKTTTLAEINILPRFIEEVEKKENWSTALSTGKNLLVSLRKFKEDEVSKGDLILHPAGSLVFQQKLLPLKVDIDKIGNQKTADVKQLQINKSSGLNIEDVKENFARAQYQDLSDAEKLSKPSFEKLPGGVEISMGTGTIQNGKMVRRKIEYDVTIIDPKKDMEPKKLPEKLLESGFMFKHFIKGSSVTKSKLSNSYNERLQPYKDKLDVREELFTVAFQDSNRAFNSNATFASEMEAQNYMQEHIRANPNMKKQIHIVPQSELIEI